MNEMMKKIVDYANKNSKNLLIVSIVIDAIGMISYLLPVFGETLDAFWSPIYVLLLNSLYGNDFFSIAGGIEEILPFTDVIPTTTLAWLYYKFVTKTI